MKKNKLMILGYFGYHTNQLDGQTIKTRNVFKLLKSKKNEFESISHFDTQSFQLSKFQIFKMLLLVIKVDKLIYLPAHKNLKYIFPFIFVISKIFNTEIIYIVIGGWLSDFLKNKFLHKFFLKRIKAILTETLETEKKLKKNYLFKNISILPNFRIHSFKHDPHVTENSLKIVFMARITKLKGIDIVFKLSEFLKDNYENKDVNIDIYGPVNKSETEYFYHNLERNKKVSYKGVVEPKDVYNTLSCYDLMILPTRYPGEGFPGSILDAYISGIPVIATNWKHIPEFIDIGKTGFLFDIENVSDLYDYIDLLYKDHVLLLQMKKNAYLKSKQYSSDFAWKIIKPFLVN